MGNRLKKSGESRFNIRPIITAIVIIVLAIGFVHIQKNLTVVDSNMYSSTYLPRQYSGYKIVHISNLDNENLNVVSKIKKEKPDLIIVSGGIVDKHGQFNKSVNLLNKLSDITDTFYVLQDKDIKFENDIVRSTTATYINGRSVTLNPKATNATEYISVNGDKWLIKEAGANTEEAKQYNNYINSILEEDKDKTVQIVGVNGNGELSEVKDSIYSSMNNDAYFTILLLGNYKVSPDLNDLSIDMVFTGGTYGVADTDYKSGDYTVNDYKLIVNRGLASNIPKEFNTQRFLNFPEIQSITLHDGKVYKRNPLEKLLENVVGDVGTIFDNDEGFREYKYEYGIYAEELEE